MRKLAVTKVEFGEKNQMKLFSFISDWGEDDSIIQDSINSGYDETESISLWRYATSAIQGGGLVIDVGAYVGFYAIVAVIENASIRCIAFEPSAASYGRLLQNIFINDLDTRILPAHLAVGREDGLLRFKHRNGVYSINSGDSSVFDFEEDHVEIVELVRLDSLLQNEVLPGSLNNRSMPLKPFGAIELLKIDVEGAEIDVLEGANCILKEHRPIIIAEALDDQAEARLSGLAQEANYFFSMIENERNILMLPFEKHNEFILGYQQWKSMQPDLQIRFERSLLTDV